MDNKVEDRNKKVTAYIERRLQSDDFPGLQYLALTQDSVIFRYSAGWADLSAKRRMQPNTTMMIYSMTKTFTAAAVLQLVEEGKISLDSPVATYLHDIPYGNEVTIRHLLSQTSGMPNPIPLKWVHLTEEHQNFDEAAALQKVVTDNAELDYTPGEKYRYSNISYWLLGRVIAEASGMRYEEYMRQSVFQRLTISRRDIDYVIPSVADHAKGYMPKWSFLNLFKSFLIDSRFIGEYEDGWLHVNSHYVNGPSFGGIVASAGAIGTFLQDQLQDTSRLFSRQTKELFFDPQRNIDGELIDMTLGWHIGRNRTGMYFFKEGGGGGFHCEMRIYLSTRLATVVIANNTSFDAGDFLEEVDPEFMGK